MNLRQAVTFAILMGADMRSKHPSYVSEKLRACREASVPEVYLDGPNLFKFQSWAGQGGFDWNKDRDLARPVAELRTGEEE